MLSIGSVDTHYILTEEPEPSDRLIRRMCTAVAAETETPACAQDPCLHGVLPFELRCLEVVLEEAAKLLMVEVRGVVRSAHLRMTTLREPAVRSAPFNCCSCQCAPPVPRVAVSASVTTIGI